MTDIAETTAKLRSLERTLAQQLQLSPYHHNDDTITFSRSLASSLIDTVRHAEEAAEHADRIEHSLSDAAVFWIGYTAVAMALIATIIKILPVGNVWDIAFIWACAAAVSAIIIHWGRK